MSNSLAMSTENRRSGRYFTPLHRDGPIPWQEFVEPVDGVIVDASQHVGEPSLRIDVIELGRRDQRGHDRGPASAAFGAGEQPRLATAGCAIALGIPFADERWHTNRASRFCLTPCSMV